VGHRLRTLNVHCLAVFQEFAGVKVGVFLESLPRSEHPSNDFVLNIGDVHYVMNIISEVLEIATKDIDRYEGSEISDVTVVIDSWAARIHSHLVAVERLELFLAASDCISQSKHYL